MRRRAQRLRGPAGEVGVKQLLRTAAELEVGGVIVVISACSAPSGVMADP